jgi:hypothetical protein
MNMENVAEWHTELNEGYLPILETPSGNLIGETSVFWKDFKSDQGIDLFLKPNYENKK